MFNWKDPLKHASLWLSGVATAALTFFFMFPGEALTVWNTMPPEVKALLPQATGVQISLGLLIASIIAKWVPQATVAAWVKARAGKLVAWLSFLLKESGGAAPAKKAVAGGGIAAALLLLVGPVAYKQLHHDVPAHEAVVLKGYLDPVGIPTKCAGDTTDVEVGRVYTNEECQVSLDTQLLLHAEPVLKCSPALADHPYILAATIDLTYNIGASAYCNSTVARRFHAGDFRGGCAAMSAWVYAKGRKLPGLVKRRAENRALCERGL